MAAPPARNEISAPYPNPSNATAREGFGKLWDYVTSLLGMSGQADDARVALGFASITAGDAGKSLAVNALGDGFDLVPIPVVPVFSATRSGTFSMANSTQVKIICDSEVLDAGGDYNPTLGRFTAPVGGAYQFNAVFDVTSTPTGLYPMLYVNGSEVRRGNVNNNSGNAGVSAIIQLSAGDYVEFYGMQQSGVSQGAGTPLRTYFDGALVRALP